MDFVLSLGKLASICPKALAEEDEGHLREEKSILDVFSALLSYTSFFHYRIIETLVIEFGTPQDGEKLKQYVAAFNRFCKRSVFEVPPNVFVTGGKNPTTLVIQKGKIPTTFITRGGPSNSIIIFTRRKAPTTLTKGDWCQGL